MREIPSPVAGATTLEETVDAIAAGFDPRVEEIVVRRRASRGWPIEDLGRDLLLDQLRDAHRAIVVLAVTDRRPRAIAVVGGCFCSRANIGLERDLAKQRR